MAEDEEEVKLSCATGLTNKLMTFIPTLELNEDHVERAVSFVIQCYSKEFGKNLREIREKRKITQDALAEALGVSSASYWAWETGYRTPKIENFKRLVEILEIDPGDLLWTNPIIPEDLRKIPIIRASSGACMDHFTLPRSFIYDADKYKDYCMVSSTERYDFAYLHENTDMMGELNAIPPGALVFCTSKLGLEDAADPEESFKVANGHVALVNVLGRHVFLREVHFDGHVLHLIPWNKSAKEMAFPNGSEYTGEVDPPSLMVMDGFPTHANNVRIIGIVLKVSFDVKACSE